MKKAKKQQLQTTAEDKEKEGDTVSWLADDNQGRNKSRKEKQQQQGPPQEQQQPKRGQKVDFCLFIAELSISPKCDL